LGWGVFQKSKHHYFEWVCLHLKAPIRQFTGGGTRKDNAETQAMTLNMRRGDFRYTP
jgi:hypothetical protein